MDEQQQRGYHDCVMRLYDAPGDPEVRDAMLVFGDVLQTEGDPRGELVALGDALSQARRAGDRALQKELQTSIDSHIDTHRRDLLGPLDWLRQFERAIALEWRGGYIYAARLDIRHVREEWPEFEPEELVGMLLASPSARFMRRLAVRVRRHGDVVRVARLLADTQDGSSRISPHTPPLEELIIGPSPRPRRLVKREATDRPLMGFRYSGNAVSHLQLNRLVEPYPGLYMLSLDDLVSPLPMGKMTPEKVASIRAMAGAEPGNIVYNRVRRTALGRALWAYEPHIRKAALDVIAKLGEFAAGFLPSLELMLRPRFMARQVAVINCLSTMGATSSSAVPTLLGMTGRVRHYDAETRSAAGSAAARILAQLRGK
ncbi:MAG: hypothetical protein MJE77_46345 [Proteobacteria bacterium]|nr:hypothetical protein [Pseudomonadota bacterium]